MCLICSNKKFQSMKKTIKNSRAIYRMAQQIPPQLHLTFLGIAHTIIDFGGKAPESEVSVFPQYRQFVSHFTVKDGEWSADWMEFEVAEKTEKQPANRMVRPTVQEVAEYMLTINGSAEEAFKFVDWYSTNGWLVGKAKAPMKDWKAASRSWLNRNPKTPKDDKLGARSTKSELSDLHNKVAALGGAGQ